MKKMKKLICMILAIALVFNVAPMSADNVSAATSSYAPYANIEYSYSASVRCGTIRYMSQVTTDSYFNWNYWPSGAFGGYSNPGNECGTASISMALSYIGISKTPKEILEPYNGYTQFIGWGGSSHTSMGASSITTAMSNYINGNGKYSPPVIHLPGYSSAGHYVVVVGQISSNTYQILDPWQRQVTSMTINGTSASYVKGGKTINDKVDQLHQWYNAGAVITTDTTAPVISNEQISDVTNTGYTVTCTVTDNVGVTRVAFPTWSYDEAGQDDLLWYEGTISGNTATCRIDISKHGNQANVSYATHIYAYDAAGNSTQGKNLGVYIDGTAPVITDATVSDVTEDGFTVTCTVTDDREVGYVLFPTWTSYNGQDDLRGSDGSWPYLEFHKGTLVNGQASFRVNKSDHNNETGEYTIHIYAYDASGNTGMKGLTYNFEGVYTVSFNANGGSGAPSAQTTIVGDKITLSSTIPTRSGYKFKGWSPSATATAAKYQPGETFTAEGSMTLYAVWEEDKVEDVYVNPFSDVSDTAWYASAVRYVHENGMMSGNNGLFNPTGNITRAQVVATLYKLEGSPKVTDYRAIAEMVDVEAGQWYTNAVCWAYNVGVANGNSVTKKFNMSDPVTRQQLATFFYNYAKYKGLDTTTRGDISGMAGADQVASYAMDTVKWAVGTGLISGSETTVNGVKVYDLKPTGTATRAQMASIMMKFCQNNDGLANAYTVTWEDANGKFITVKRTASPKANASIGNLAKGDKIYTGDILKVSYSTHDTWTIDSYGMENITVTGNVNSKQIYMTVWSDWSDWSETVVNGSNSVMAESKTQYRYADKQTTTSTNSSLSGWTQTGSNTSYGSWGGWSAWQTDAVGGSDTREVQTSTVYGYYYFLCPSCGAHMHGWPTCFTWAGGCGKSTLSVNNGVMIWSTTSWNSAGLYEFHGTGKYATDSLGAGTSGKFP